MHNDLGSTPTKSYSYHTIICTVFLMHCISLLSSLLSPFGNNGYFNSQYTHNLSRRKNYLLQTLALRLGRSLANCLSIGHRRGFNLKYPRKSTGLFPRLNILTIFYLSICSPTLSATAPAPGQSDILRSSHTAQSSQQPVNLDDIQNAIIPMHLNSTASIHLNLHDDHAVLFSTQVEDSKHIVAVSRLIDFSNLAQANSNAQYTARYPTLVLDWERPDHFLRLSGNQLYYISDTSMTFSECHLDCASKQSKMLHKKGDLKTLIREKPGRFVETPVWIKTESRYHGSLDNSYKLYLDNSAQIYPAKLNNHSSIHFYRHSPKNDKMIKIKDIAHHYTYYDGNSGSYWIQHKHQLLTTVDSDWHFQAMIPVPANTVTPLSYKAHCACVKNLQSTNTAYNRLVSDIELYKHTLVPYNLSIPFLRLKSPISDTAEVATLLFDDDSSHHLTQYGLDRLYNESDILNLTISNNKAELYNSIAYWAFRSVFGPMILSKASDELLKLAAKPNTIQIPWSAIDSISNDPLSEDMHFSPLKDDRQWILNYTGKTLEEPLRWSIEDFNRDINRLSDRNRIFLQFIQHKAASILAKQLQDKIPYTLDNSFPVTVRQDIKSSFAMFTFYFLCHSAATSTTLYNVAPLPMLYTDKTFLIIEAPAQVSTSTTHHGYQVLSQERIFG